MKLFLGELISLKNVLLVHSTRLSEHSQVVCVYAIQLPCRLEKYNFTLALIIV